jgi:hypothetical protein
MTERYEREVDGDPEGELPNEHGHAEDDCIVLSDVPSTRLVSDRTASTLTTALSALVNVPTQTTMSPRPIRCAAAG